MAAQQADARKIMQSLGYGPGNRLKVKVSTRDFATYRDPAVIFVDQLNKVHFDAELEVIESSIWHNRLAKKDYTVALNTSGVGIDDPDAVLKGAYACNSEANYTKYCTPQVDKLLDEQSQQADVEKRKAIVWEIERVLAEDVARPIVYHNRSGTCWQPHLKGYVHAREQHLQQLALRQRLARQVAQGKRHGRAPFQHRRPELALTSSACARIIRAGPYDTRGRDRPVLVEMGRRRRSNRPGTSQAKGPQVDGTLESSRLSRRLTEGVRRAG